MENETNLENLLPADLKIGQEYEFEGLHLRVAAQISENVFVAEVVYNENYDGFYADPGGDIPPARLEFYSHEDVSGWEVEEGDNLTVPSQFLVVFSQVTTDTGNELENVFGFTDVFYASSQKEVEDVISKFMDSTPDVLYQQFDQRDVYLITGTVGSFTPKPLDDLHRQLEELRVYYERPFGGDAEDDEDDLEDEDEYPAGYPFGPSGQPEA